MMSFGKMRAFALLSALFVTFTLVSTDFADARRGGSFGSRGSRTFSAPAPTRTAPSPAGPVERTMTPNPGSNPAARQNQTMGQQRPGMFSGFGGSLMRGLLVGGLIGMLFGYGFGGLAGALGFVLQLILVAVVAALVIGYFRSRRTPAMAGGPRNSPGRDFGRDSYRRESGNLDQPQGNGRAGSFSIPSFGSGNAAAAAPASQDIELGQADLDMFERMLAEVQEAFSSEDHAALRRLVTPEMVSYLSEELAQNASKGVRNEVSGTRLVQADVAEAWREDGDDYATAAFLYESVDVLRDRKTGNVVSGEVEPSETTEHWTFTRRGNAPWKLSAIQEAAEA